METKNTTDDEIDFGSLAKRIISIIGYPFKVFRNNLFITSIFILGGIVFSISAKFLISKTYSSSFIIRPIDKTEKFHLEMLGDLKSLLKHKDWQTLSEELKIDTNTLAQIVNLNFSNTRLKPVRDSINFTEITIETVNYNLIIPFQNCLLKYLEESPYFSKIKELELKKLAIEELEIQKDIARIDTLKKLQIQNYPQQKNNQLVISDQSAPTAFYSMGNEKLNKKYILMARRAFLDNFQLVKNCVVVKKPTWPPRFLILISVFIPCFLFLAFIFLISKGQNVEKRNNL